MFHYELHEGEFYKLDIIENYSNSVYETFSFIDGINLPQPYIFVINKETDQLEQYKNLVVDDEKKIIYCKRTKELIEQDDSVISLFDFKFKNATKIYTEKWSHVYHINDYLPYVYTEYNGKYFIFHKHTLFPFDNRAIDMDIVEAMDHGPHTNNMALLVVKRDGVTQIYQNRPNPKPVYYPYVKMIYETSNPITSIQYTRVDNNSNTRWLLQKHQIIIYDGNNTTILLTDTSHNSDYIRKTDFNNTQVYPMDEYGEFLLVSPNDKQSYFLRVDKTGNHKTNAMNGNNPNEKEIAKLPSNFRIINCIKRDASWIDDNYISDEDNDKIYILKVRGGKMTISEVNLVASDRSKVNEKWEGLFKNGDTWWVRYYVTIPDKRAVHIQKLEQFLIDDWFIGNIDRRGIISNSVLQIPKYIEVPAYKLIGNEYETVPSFKLNKKWNTRPLDGSQIDSDSLTIEVIKTNMDKICRKEVPFDDMKLWWHDSR